VVALQPLDSLCLKAFCGWSCVVVDRKEDAVRSGQVVDVIKVVPLHWGGASG
jgi:hypothetical protein